MLSIFILLSHSKKIRFFKILLKDTKNVYDSNRNSVYSLKTSA